MFFRGTSISTKLSSANFPLPLCAGEARYSCQHTIELIRWIIWSPPWFCLCPFFCILSGQKLWALWKAAMWHLAACALSEGQRGPGAHLMEMQKLYNIQRDFFSQSAYHQGDVSGFAHSHDAPAHQPLAKPQKNKVSMNKNIFPWMKESRHSNQKHGRRITGL